MEKYLKEEYDVFEDKYLNNEYDIVAIKQFDSENEVLYYILNDKKPNYWDWAREEKVALIYKKEIEIKDGIGYFDDEFIDVINVQVGDKIYEIVPIDGKFAVPYIENEVVNCIYKKYAKCNVININNSGFYFKI